MSRFFGRWLARSLLGNVAAGAVSMTSLAIAAGLAFALVAVSRGVEAQLGADLRAYGANVVLLPRDAPLRVGLGAYELGAVDEERVLAVADLAALPPGLVERVAPGLVVRLRAAGRDVGAVGWDLAALRALHPAWRVTPRWAAAEDEVMAGTTLAASLGLRPGAAIEVEAGGRRAVARVAAVVETGGAEDENLFLPLALAQRLVDRPGQASLALARVAAGVGRPVEDCARAVMSALPGVEARTLRQVAHAEEALLAKVRRLLSLVTAAVLAAAAFTVAGTAGVLLLARRGEIGLYLALGATPGGVRRLLLAEAAATGIAGGLAGCLLGAAAAEAIAGAVFGGLVPLPPVAGAVALAAALAVSLGASAWPVHRAVGASPHDILRAP
jgi:putative ABC transport system permease protein